MEMLGDVRGWCHTTFCSLKQGDVFRLPCDGSEYYMKTEDLGYGYNAVGFNLGEAYRFEDEEIVEGGLAIDVVSVSPMNLSIDMEE